MAWKLAGHEVAHGRTEVLPEPDAASLVRAKAGAETDARRLGVSIIDQAQLKAFQNEVGRTVFLLDMRSPDAWAKGHLAGSVPAPNWESHAWVHRHVCTRNSRIVVIDDAEQVLGLTTAAWLRQLGLGEVYVLRDALAPHYPKRAPTSSRAPRRSMCPL